MPSTIAQKTVGWLLKIRYAITIILEAARRIHFINLIFKYSFHNTDAYNQVYDVTTYISHHPGGDKIFINAGNDNTDGNLIDDMARSWTTCLDTPRTDNFVIGFYGEQHPATVEDMVSQYYIGDLAD